MPADVPVVPESHRDLLAASTAFLATNTTAGPPQVTAVWFLHDEAVDRVKFSINNGRKKIQNLRRDPSATCFIIDPANPFRTLEIRGTVSIEPDPDYAFAATVGEKYGADLKAFDEPGATRSVLTLTPTRVVANVVG
jgi:PPOX class probable F420-dependent enzyme